MDKILKNLNENDNLIDIIYDCNNSIDYREYTKNLEKTCNSNIKEAIIYSMNNKDINNYILKDHIIKHIKNIIKNGLIDVTNIFLLMNIMNEVATEYKFKIINKNINFEYINDLIGKNSKLYYDIDSELFNFCISEMLIPFTKFSNNRKILYENINLIINIQNNLDIFVKSINDKEENYTNMVINTILYLYNFYYNSLNIIDYKKYRPIYLNVISFLDSKNINTKELKKKDIYLSNN